MSVGHDTGIYHGTFFDLGPNAEIEIGSFATLVGVIISTNGRVVIGDYAFLAHEVVLADSHAATPFAGDADDNRTRQTGEPGMGIEIGPNVWIGARAVLLTGARIGEGAIVGAAAVVDSEVQPNAIVAGNPARQVGWVR